MEAGWLVTLSLLGIGGAAGLGGAIFGLGGGFVIVPMLTLVFGVPIRTAVAAGLVAVVATSTASAAGYLRLGRVDIPLAFRLESAAAVGAVAGTIATGFLPEAVIYVAFALVCVLASVLMLRRRTVPAAEVASAAPTAEAVPAGQGASAGEAPPAGRTVSGVQAASVVRSAGESAPNPASPSGDSASKRLPGRHRRPLAAGSAIGLAGLGSAILGLGGGFAKVPTMHLLLAVPIHVAVATSTLMIGMTAATGAWLYWVRGDLILTLAAPLALGVLGGGTLGSRLSGRISARALRVAFAVVLLLIATQMGWRGLQGVFH